MDNNNPKDKVGSKKDLISLVPPEGIRGISRAMKYGAREAKRLDGGLGYGDYNWRQTKVRLSIYLDAIMRHTMALIDGEDGDLDSGLPHEDHIGANVCIIKDAKKHDCLIDDRATIKVLQEMVKENQEKGLYEIALEVEKDEDLKKPWGIDDSGCEDINDLFKRMKIKPDQYYKGEE